MHSSGLGNLQRGRAITWCTATSKASFQAAAKLLLNYTGHPTLKGEAVAALLKAVSLGYQTQIPD